MSEMTVLDNRGMGEVEIARNTGNKAQQKEKREHALKPVIVVVLYLCCVAF